MLDIDIGGILDLIKANATRNSKLIKANFNVFGLDFFANKWSSNLESKLTNVTVVLVADGERIKQLKITALLMPNSYDLINIAFIFGCI